MATVSSLSSPRPRSRTATEISAEYQPEEDVIKISEYFAQRYGNLEKALKTFDHDDEFDLYAFEVALKKWGVKVDNVVELFDHIDMDWSGRISVRELFWVLELPVQEIRERERRRQKDEVRRTLEQLARSIREKFGSVDEAVAKHGLQGGSAEAGVSLAKFRQLVNKLGMQLDAAQLQRVFHDIDEDSTGVVSTHELQKALSYHLVRDSLVELACTLVERHGSVVAAFEDPELGDLQFQERPALAADAQRPAAAPLPALTEDKFLRLLRHLKVLEQVTEATALLLHSSMKPFSIEDLVQRLREEHTLREEEKRRREEENERREREERRMLRKQAFNAQSRQRVEEVVGGWVQKVENTNAWNAPDVAAVTRDWALEARAGASKEQLSDYLHVLQDCLDEKRHAADELREAVEQEGAEVDNLHDCLAHTPSSHATHHAPRSGEATPMTPSTPYLTPASRTDLRADGSNQTSKAEKAERLIQAAAVGDVPGVQGVLGRRADVNAVGWGGVTPLMAAARHGRLATLDCLVACGADVLRTDMNGRTAVDHAYRQPRARDWLRACGGLSSKELAEEATELARCLLETEAERVRLEERRRSLPSRDVVQKAKLRQAQRFGLQSPDSVPRGPRFYNSPHSSPEGSPPRGGAPMLPIRSILANRGGSGAPKHVRLTCLPARSAGD